jgi:hypothetical protein
MKRRQETVRHSLGDAGQNAERCRTGDSRPGAADGALSRLRYPVLFPVALAPKTREQIVTRRDTSNGKVSDFNRRRTKLCFGKGEVESSIPSSSTISFTTDRNDSLDSGASNQGHPYPDDDASTSHCEIRAGQKRPTRKAFSLKTDAITASDRLCNGLSSAQWH